jgi:hypothetical protein
VALDGSVGRASSQRVYRTSSSSSGRHSLRGVSPGIQSLFQHSSNAGTTNAHLDSIKVLNESHAMHIVHSLPSSPPGQGQAAAREHQLKPVGEDRPHSTISSRSALSAASVPASTTTAMSLTSVSAPGSEHGSVHVTPAPTPVP